MRKGAYVCILLAMVALCLCSCASQLPSTPTGSAQDHMLFVGNVGKTSLPTASPVVGSASTNTRNEGFLFAAAPSPTPVKREESPSDRFVFIDSDSDAVKNYVAKKQTPAPTAERAYDSSFLFITLPQRGDDSATLTATPAPQRTASPQTKPTPQPANILAEIPQAELFTQTGGVACRYAYQQLTRTQKQLYTEMYDGILAFKASINVKGTYTAKDFERVFHVFINECPELFQLKTLGNYYCITATSKVTAVKPSYRMTKAEYTNAWMRMKRMINDLKNQTDFGVSDYDHVIAIERYLVDTITYHLGEENSFADTALLKGTGKCDGYSNAAMLFMRCYNIPVAGVTGWTYHEDGVRSETPHRWNMVQLDGRWYHSDTTWNDDGEYLVAESLNAKKNDGLQFLPYSNISDQKMLFRRDLDMFYCDWPVPSSYGNAQEYYRYHGYIADDSTSFQDSIHAALDTAFKQSHDAVVISFTSPQKLADNLSKIRSVIFSWHNGKKCISKYRIFFFDDVGVLILTGLRYQ